MKKWPWIFGLVTGVVLAWAFAPEKGSVLRKKIAKDRRGGKLGLAPLKRDVVGAIADATAEARKLYKSGKVKQLATKGEETLKEIGGQVTKHFKDEIDLIKELYRNSGREDQVSFHKHALIGEQSKPRAKKRVTKSPVKRAESNTAVTKKKAVSRKSGPKA